jgi:hypothetical protein
MDDVGVQPAVPSQASTRTVLLNLSCPHPLWRRQVACHGKSRLCVDQEIRLAIWLRPCGVFMADSPVYLVVDPRPALEGQPTQFPNHFPIELDAARAALKRR